MTEVVPLLSYGAVVIAAAGYGFVRPSRIYWRSTAGVVGVALGGALTWLLASAFFAVEPGSGFAVWGAAVLLALAIAIAASAAATVRHAINAMGARLAPIF